MRDHGRTNNRYREILGRAETGPSNCQWIDCKEGGKYRAPVNRELRKFYCLCLEHVRKYNSQWNYHEGMSESEIELEIRNSTTWDRPTWPVGNPGKRSVGWHGTSDIFGILGNAANKKDPCTERENRVKEIKLGTEHKKALKIFNLEGRVSVKILKSRYKLLVKKYHPDANGGCAKAGQRMKLINLAYAKLREILTQ